MKGKLQWKKEKYKDPLGSNPEILVDAQPLVILNLPLYTLLLKSGKLAVELLAEDGREIVVRKQQPIPLPSVDEYGRHGIELEQAPGVQVFELCRYLANIAREQVLA
jgi:hypothetical protein